MNAQPNRRICITRGMKNARYLETVAGDKLPPGFAGSLDPETLNALHAGAVPAADLGQVPGLRQILGATTIPSPAALPAGSLFNGTVHFVQVAFTTAQGVIALSAADMATVMAYAQNASGPIAMYASQFGPCGLKIDRTPIAYSVDLRSGADGQSYSDQTLQTWVNAIARQQQLTNACLVVLSPPGVVNTDAQNGVLGYHAQADVPYIFGNVLGQGFTLDDAADVYALVVSHELAEMTVDPSANLANPEVCDGCGPNCQTVFRDYFDASSAYLETSQAFPPGSPYGYFINAIVQPPSATQCPAPSSACAYPPPTA